MPDSTRTASKRGWTTVAFGDVVRQVKDRIDPDDSGLDRYVAGEHMDTDDLRIRRWGLVGDGCLGPAFHMRFKPGHVLYGSRRTYLRKVALADFEGITANTTYVLESSDPEVLLPELLPFIMQTEAFAQHSVRESKGSVNPYVNFSDLAWFEFALPPIEEQRRLISLFQAAATTSSELMSLASAVQNVERILGQQLGEGGNAISVALGEVCRVDIKKVKLEPNATYRAAGVLNGGQGMFEKERFRGAETRYQQMTVLRHDQLVMRKLTAWEGAIAVVPKELEGALVSSEFPTMSLDATRLAPGFLAWIIRQPSFWREMRARSKGTALRRSRLHQRDLLDIRIPLPNVDRQLALVRRLDEARNARDAAMHRALLARNIGKVLIESKLAIA